MSLLRPATIRARIALGTFVLLAATLGVAGGIVDEVVRESTLHALDGRLVAEAEALATLTRFDGRKVELEFEDETMTAYVSTRSGAYFQVSTRRGLVERSRSLGDARLPEPDAELLEQPLEPGARRTTHRDAPGPRGPVRLLALAVTRSADPEGDDDPRAPRTTVVVQVARELATLESARAPARIALAVALPLALVLGTAGAFLVAGRATSPISRFAEEARAIGASSLERRLALASTEGELHDLARQLNEAFDRLAAAVERERRFASDVAHELRTPLAVGRSSLELALLQDRSPEEYRAALRAALDAGKRLEQLVGSLLLLGRAEQARRSDELLDLRGPLAASIQSLESVAAGTATPLRGALGETPALVRGEPLLLERLAANLVENALRHGAGPGGVDVALAVEGGSVVLSVLDRGPGFAPELLARPFERFARGDASRNRATGGAGLGLALVRAIARAHGGDATLERREGGGAAVRVRLPLAARQGT